MRKGGVGRCRCWPLLPSAPCCLRYRVLKGWSRHGDAAPHARYCPASTKAGKLASGLAIGAFVAGLACAWAERCPEGEQSRDSGHGDMGFVFSGMLGFGLVIFCST